MKMIIIGAGATAYSCYANPERRPPCLDHSNRFLEMFNDPPIFRKTVDLHYKPFFQEAINLCNQNIEELFTGIYMLANPNLFNNELKEERLLKLKEAARKVGNIEHPVTFVNVLSIFRLVLREEIQLCIGTKGKSPAMPLEMLICPWHRKVAAQLKAQDIVVNFNYDLVMSYALLNERKLSQKSFLNSHIKEVDIHQKLISTSPVLLITLHGSFSWYKQNESLNYTATETGREIINRHLSNLAKNISISDEELKILNQKLHPTHITVGLNRYPPKGNYSLSNVILPLQKKKQILNNLPYFEEEYQLFLKKLQEVDEIWLIGKQFKTADQDIAQDILNVCHASKVKSIIYANPSVECPEWVEHHNKIFNATPRAFFKSLEDCYKELKTKK